MAAAAQGLPADPAPEEHEAREGADADHEDWCQQHRALEREVRDPDGQDDERRHGHGGGKQAGAHRTTGYARTRGGGELRLGRRLRHRVPGPPLRLQRRGLRGACHRRGSSARARRRQRPRRGRDRRPGRARLARLDRRAAQRSRPLSRPPLGAGLARRRRVARLLAEEARVPERLARPPRQGGHPRRRLGRGARRLRVSRPERRPRSPRARPRAFVARAAVPALIRAGLIAGYLAALLAVDTQVDLRGQLVLGALTWIALLLAARTLPLERRFQVLVVICAATVAELTGSIVWGVYSYRLHNLPTFVPPAHGLVFIAGLSLSQALRAHTRALVLTAATIATAWGVLGLTVLPRTDAAGALGVPLLLAFLWRSRARAAYAGVFLVVAWLELYGTAIGTWRWAEHLPGLGIPDGNPPSGVASGYVWFDVMALLLAPRLIEALERARALGGRREVPAAAFGGCGLRPPTILLGLRISAARRFGSPPGG